MDELLQLIYPEASEYVDWHTLLVTLAQPYPIPSTQDLLNALKSYRAIANSDTLISRDQYDKVYNLNPNKCFVDDVYKIHLNVFVTTLFFQLCA